MMGTAGELPKEPVKKTLFEEDMTEEQLAEAVSTIYYYYYYNYFFIIHLKISYQKNNLTKYSILLFYYISYNIIINKNSTRFQVV